MLNKLQALALAALVGSSVIALVPMTSTSASALPAPGVSDTIPQLATDGTFQQVQNRRDRRRQWFYNRRHHGYRYRYPYRNYHYYYGGYYYDQPYWNFYVPFYFGSPVSPYYYAPRYNAPRYGNYGNRHIRWCLARYRSYNVRTNTWVSYSGAVRQCISPFGP